MQQQSPDPRRWRVLAIMVLSVLPVVLDGPTTGVALPSIQRGLATGQAQAGWVLNGWTLSLALLIGPGRALSSRAARRALVLGLVVVGAGSAASAFAPSIGWLLASRTVAGSGAALVLPAALSVLTAIFEPAARHRALAIWAGFTGLAVVAGPVVSGVLLGHFWWGSVFVLALLLVVPAVAAVLRFVPAGTGRPLTAAAPMPAAARTADSAGRTTSRAQLSEPSFAAGLAATALAAFVLAGSTFCLTFYLQDVRRLSPLHAGLVMLPLGAGVLWFSPRAAALAVHRGTRTVVTGGLLAVAGSLYGVLLLGRTTGDWLVVAVLLVQGAGLAHVLTPALGAASRSVSATATGTGSAVAGAVRLAGAALGILVLGAVLTASYRSQHVGTQLGPRVRPAAAESIGSTQRYLAGSNLPAGPRSRLEVQAERAFVRGWHLTALGAAVLTVLATPLLAAGLPGRRRSSA